LSKTRVQEGFVITTVNGVEIKNIDEFKAAIANTKDGKVRLDGIYPGYEGNYTYPLNLNEETE
jgi:S1-C subfamily serine protease